jgi:hypothetical protein
MTRLLAAVLAVGLSGCATTSQQESDLDRVKIAAVEKAAARVGVGVYWVNAPRKTAP